MTIPEGAKTAAVFSTASGAGLPNEWISDVLDALNDSVILCDAAGTITYWNDASVRIYGWSKDDAVGANIHALLKSQLVGESDNLKKTLALQSRWAGELQQVSRTGAPVFVESQWTLQRTPSDSQRIVINTDITARRQAESALTGSEKGYSRYVDENLTASFVMQPDGTIVTCNPAFVRSFGFASIDDARGENVVSLLRSRKEAAELLSVVQEHGTVERHEVEMRQLNGDRVYVAARLVGSFDAGGHLLDVQGYLFNDTRRKRLEEQLIQAQKMEGLGTLAGGIAHDFNNILAIILGYASQLEARNVRPEQIPPAVKVIKEAVERGAALVQQLLTSARQAEARFASLDLNELVAEVEKMLRATFPKMITFELQLQPGLPLITADRSQVHQVLLNLCVNARDAMAKGGALSLQTSVATGEELAEYFTGADADEYVRVRIRDTGAGMTPEVRAHIFEPFFTTKERAKGTGLGLSVVYGVVNNHRGFVRVESDPNRGTTFSVYLPVALQPEQSEGAGGVSAPQKSREPQTILLVEDEEMLRDLAVQILQGEGYRILAARDGLEAVETFEAHRDEIGLVICDLGLPKLGGRDVFMRMKQIKPSVRAIVASGYLEPTTRSEILKAGVIDTIQKPYDFRELLVKIRSVIGNAQSEDDHPQLF